MESDRCECGHWLQPADTGDRCVMGCTYQADRDDTDAQ